MFHYFLSLKIYKDSEMRQTEKQDVGFSAASTEDAQEH